MNRHQAHPAMQICFQLQESDLFSFSVINGLHRHPWIVNYHVLLGEGGAILT